MTWSRTSGGTRRRSGPHSREADGWDDPSATLEKAAVSVAASWRNECGDATSIQEASELLDAIVAATMPRAEDPPPVDARLRSVLGRRLVELFRAAVVREWRQSVETPPASQILTTLGAIESLRANVEPDWAQHFASRLSGPDGLSLVVEVAHDLRSPLTSILFLAETLQRGHSGEVNELQRRQLGLVYSAALGLSGMASNVIELARGGTRLAEEEPSPFSVTDVMESVHDITRPMAEEKGLTIRLNPPRSDHRLGHPLALSRVLLNLTTNALKFTEEGFVEIVARETGTTQIEFSVRDTGHGISPKALETLYSPFRRAADGDRYAFSGTGLGLALCRKLVEALGSELRVESKPDWGTRFQFEIELHHVDHI